MKKNLILSLFAAMTALCLAGCATADTASRPEQPLPLTGTVWIPQFLSNQDKAGLSDDAVVRLVIARTDGAAARPATTISSAMPMSRSRTASVSTGSC